VVGAHDMVCTTKDLDVRLPVEVWDCLGTPCST
jgi:hypothetical protein